MPLYAVKRCQNGATCLAALSGPTGYYEKVHPLQLQAMTSAHVQEVCIAFVLPQQFDALHALDNDTTIAAGQQ